MDQNLAGLTAVVTGASGGLGGHFARLLSQAGAAVAVTARRLDIDARPGIFAFLRC